jgi:signal transduction histidine kinase
LKLRGILKRHFLRVGLIAVVVPLLIILGMQYRSLVELERTMPVARREYMRKYLVTVARDTYEFYRAAAERTLDIPPRAFDQQRPRIVQSDIVVDHFKGNPTEAARRLFIATTAEVEDRYYAIVYFYNPQTGALENDLNSPEGRAAHAACAPWLAHRMTNTALESASLTVHEFDPGNRVIVKPIIDEGSRQVIGAAGMIIDEAYFKNTVLPSAIEQSVQKYFPDEYKDVIVTALDSGERVVMASEPFEGQPYEVGGAFPFLFKDWRLGIRMRRMTEDQWARRAFTFNLSLTLLMTLLLVGGIALALRAASREMRLSQMKSDFVSNVSHELRTPLASIRVFAEFLRLGRVREREKIREYGEYIETESRRLTQLINNILDFSRIESGRKTYQMERADVKEVLLDALKTFEVQLAQQGFNIIFESARPLPPAIIDPEAISRAFLNLLDNAVKYSGESREITVRLDKRDEYITISVTDHGIGISREERDKIFEKFYRVSTGLVHDVKGSGLGLSIVKHIVDAHRGLLTLNSKPGAGSTFTIYLLAEHLPTQAPPSEKTTDVSSGQWSVASERSSGD